MQRHNLYACPSGIICGRLAAGRGLLQRHNLYAYPVGDSLQSPVGVAEPYKRLGKYRSPRRPSFCSCKRKQNRVKGEIPP